MANLIPLLRFFAPPSLRPGVWHWRLLLGCWLLPLWGLAADVTECSGGFAPLPDQAAQALGARPGEAWSIRPGGNGTLQVHLGTTSRILELYVAGCPNGSASVLSLFTPDHRDELKLAVRRQSGSEWELHRWALPVAWRQRDVLLLAATDGPDHPLGVALPSSHRRFREARWLVLGQGLGAAGLTLLPFFSALVLLRRRCAADPALWIALALAACGVYALAGFFVFFLSHTAGLVLLGLGGLAQAYAVIEFCHRQSKRWTILTGIAAAFALASTMLALLLLYGGTFNLEDTPANRHELGLPVDNLLPRILAERVYDQIPLRPFVSDWLSSDRPPLQAGVMLWSHPLFPGRAGSLSAAITAQFAVYAGLLVLLLCLGLGRRRIGWCLGLCAFSGFFILNTVYAWPKLLPAGYLLVCTGLLYRIAQAARPARISEAVVLGLCAALAMLGHGGSFFGLLALALGHLVWGRGHRDLRLIGLAAAYALAAYAPWLAYQHFFDPPGDRLMKYHLAGHPALDPRGMLAVIREAYAQTSLADILANKLTNFRVLFGDPSRLWSGLTSGLSAVAGARWADAYWEAVSMLQPDMFFHFFSSAGVLILGLAGLWRPHGGAPGSPEGGWYCLRLCLIGLLLWCLLMFGPASTLVHQGSYLFVVLLHVAALLGLTRLSRTVRGLILLSHVATGAFIWTLSPEWDCWHNLLRPTVDSFWLAVLITSALVTMLCGWISCRPGSPGATPP